MRRKIYWLMALIVAGIVGLLFCPESAEVRIDCGDIRYRILGIPISTRRLPEPYRSDLLAIAKTSKKLPQRWVWINLDTTHGTDGMCQGTYLKAAPWANVDPVICRLLLEDSADFVETRHWQGGLPRTIGYFFDRAPDGTPIIPADWKQNEDVQQYCLNHAYTPS